MVVYLYVSTCIENLVFGIVRTRCETGFGSNLGIEHVDLASFSVFVISDNDPKKKIRSLKICRNLAQTQVSTSKLSMSPKRARTFKPMDPSTTGDIKQALRRCKTPANLESGPDGDVPVAANQATGSTIEIDTSEPKCLTIDVDNSVPSGEPMVHDTSVPCMPGGANTDTVLEDTPMVIVQDEPESSKQISNPDRQPDTTPAVFTPEPIHLDIMPETQMYEPDNLGKQMSPSEQVLQDIDEWLHIAVEQTAADNKLGVDMTTFEKEVKFIVDNSTQERQEYVEKTRKNCS